MAERVLVTGATGFVGLPIVAALARRGWRVEAVTHRRSVPEIPGVIWSRADLLDATEVAALICDVRPTHLVHAAWYVVHGKFWTAPENQTWLEASAELAASFFEYGGRRFVGIGTCAEYARQDSGDALPWPEGRKVDPDTPYGQAKADLARRLFALAEKRTDAEVAWARLFHLFGPNEHPARLVPSLARALIAGEEARCGSGKPVRDFSSTWYVAEALAVLVGSAAIGPVNVGSGVPQSISAFAQQISRLSGRPDLLRLGALPDREEDVPVMVADIRRLRAEVGYADCAATGRDLCRLIDLYRSSESNISDISRNWEE